MVLAVACGLATPAHAEWREAASTHFVVYANDSEKDIRTFSERLERFHSALEFLTGTRTEKPSPSSRVTIYVAGSDRKVKQLYGDGSRYVGGFYIPRAGRSLAVVPQVNTRGKIDDSMITLLHEYAHHFVSTSSNFPIPKWLSEGGAEFFASASYSKDGAMSVGRPAHHRAYELLLMPEVPLTEIFDERLYLQKKRNGYDSFYGRAWLLYHYLTFSEERRGQLPDYMQALVKGTPSLEAAGQVFGDLGKLDKELDAYLKEPRIFGFTLSPDKLAVGPVEIRTLGKGEAAMLPIVIRSARGVNEEEAAEVLIEARRVAELYPNDPFVQTALAEAEHDAGNDPEAIAAADAALAADPTRVNAYVQKGYALFRIADQIEEENERKAAFARAMAPFLELNKLENDHPIPLVQYYTSFLAKGEDAPQLAIDGLARATQLAPFDLELRMMLALELLLRGDLENARRHLGPVAYHPHGRGASQAALRVIARLDASSEPISEEELAALFAEPVEDPVVEGGAVSGEGAS